MSSILYWAEKHLSGYSNRTGYLILSVLLGCLFSFIYYEEHNIKEEEYNLGVVVGIPSCGAHFCRVKLDNEDVVFVSGIVIQGDTIVRLCRTNRSNGTICNNRMKA